MPVPTAVAANASSAGTRKAGRASIAAAHAEASASKAVLRAGIPIGTNRQSDATATHANARLAMSIAEPAGRPRTSETEAKPSEPAPVQSATHTTAAPVAESRSISVNDGPGTSKSGAKPARQPTA